MCSRDQNIRRSVGKISSEGELFNAKQNFGKKWSQSKMSGISMFKGKNLWMWELRTGNSAGKCFKKIHIFPLFFNSAFTFYVEGSSPALGFHQVVTATFCLPAVSRGYHETGWCTAGLVLERRGPAGALSGPCNIASGCCGLTIIIPFWTLLELHVFFNPSQKIILNIVMLFYELYIILLLDLIAFSFIIVYYCERYILGRCLLWFSLLLIFLYFLLLLLSLNKNAIQDTFSSE